VPLEAVADVLGHTSMRVISSVYRHRTTPVVEVAVTTMDRLFDRPADLSPDALATTSATRGQIMAPV